MQWLNPLLLTGLATLVVPVLIHLLMKVQGRRTPFSTLRFFAKAQGSRDRKKIRHWPLLLVRLLLLILLVTAFSRPFWPTTQAEAAQPKARAVLILLDRSASMQARVSDTSSDTRWTAAVAAARKTLEDLTDKDQAAIVVDAEQAEIAASWGPPAGILDALGKIEPSNEAGKMSEGLQVAGNLFDQAPPDARRELVLISDLQKSSFSDLDSVALPEGAHCEIRPVAQPGMINVAVMQIARPSTTSRALAITLQNFSAVKQQDLTLTCSLDGADPFFTQKVDLDAGARTDVALPDLRTKAGWNHLAVELKNNDQLPADNHLYSAVNVPPSVPVLVVEPNMGEPRPYRRTAYFLTSALDPDSTPRNSNAPADPTRSSRPFNITVIEPNRLLDSLSSLAVPAGQGARPVVIIPPLPDVPKGLGAALKNYVSSGGGLLGWVGPRMDTVGYNSELDDLWPAHFTGTENGPGTAGAWQLAWWKNESPLFTLFQRTGHGDLTLPEFTQRMHLVATPDAEVLATYDDKTPFLLSRNVGKGRILLVNTSADTRWTDWPRRKTYLPLVQFMTSYLSQSDARAGLLLANSLAPTHNGQIDLGPAWAGKQVQLIPPSGTAVAAQADEKGLLRNLALDQPGTYEIRDAANAPLQCFAVNFPVVESDPENYSPDEVSSQLRFDAPQGANSVSALADLARASRHEIWPWLLGLLLPLLFVELALANRART